MTTKTERNLDQGRAAGPVSHATRRDLFGALPLMAAAASGTLWGAAAAHAEDQLPTGKDAAELATQVTKNSWPKPKSFVPGMHYQAMHWRMRRLLKSYAGMYLTGLGAMPCASHMLSVADVISQARCSWSALGAWLADQSEGFDPAKFPLVWRKARVIDLEQHGDQLARLRVANS